MRNKRIIASARPKRRMVVKASRTTGDMLEAFEDKLAEFGITSCDDINASEDVECSTEFEDVGGGLGEIGEVYSIEELEAFWKSDKDFDPVMSEYASFDAWLNDSINNGYFKEID